MIINYDKCIFLSFTVTLNCNFRWHAGISDTIYFSVSGVSHMRQQGYVNSNHEITLQNNHLVSVSP